ncbi:MAG: DUF4249 domain-containing protein [Prevotellaceae bacterium]|nr:DUF4249 domain-containing protein [Prevotellaceae bacterium]
MLKFSVSCRKEIELDLRTAAPVLVVEAEIVEEGFARVKLSETSGFYSSNLFPSIIGAEVSLASSRGETEQLHMNSKREFKSSTITGKSNTTYYLTINYKDKIYNAQSTLYPAVTLDSVVAKSVNPKMAPVFIAYWQDPPGKEIDYYRLRIYVNDSLEVKQNFAGSADIYDGEYISTLFMIAEVNYNNEKIYLPGDSIRFDLLTIDREAGKFFSFLNSNTKTNPPSNITGGALGYFCAYSVSSQYAEAPYWETND